MKRLLRRAHGSIDVFGARCREETDQVVSIGRISVFKSFPRQRAGPVTVNVILQGVRHDRVSYYQPSNQPPGRVRDRRIPFPRQYCSGPLRQRQTCPTASDLRAGFTAETPLLFHSQSGSFWQLNIREEKRFGKKAH
jgi:hypothetical protein